MATLTTAIGFATLLWSTLSPLVQIGIEVPIVVLSSFVFSSLFLFLLQNQKTTSTAQQIPAYHLQKRQYIVLTIALLAILPAPIIGKTNFQVLADFIKYLPQDHPRVKDSGFIAKALKSQTPLEIVITFPSEKARKILTSAQTYFIMQEFERELIAVSQGQIDQVIGPVTLFRALNMKMQNAVKGFSTAADYRVTQQAAEFGIFCFVKPFLNPFVRQKNKKKSKNAKKTLLTSYREKMRQLVSSDGNRVRFGCRLPTTNPAHILALSGHLKNTLFAKYRRLLGAEKIYITGYSLLISETTVAIYQTQQKSLLIGGITIAILMLIVIRSIGLWILSLLTNVLAVLCFFTFMAIFDISLNMYTTVLLAAFIGIVVDDTIHFLFHYRSYRNSDLENPLAATLAQVRPSILQTSIILIVGFSVFWFSSMPIYRDFALLAQVAILLALFWDMEVLPILVYWWEKRYRKN